MTRQEMITYILDYISTDTGLMTVLRLSATNNILQVPDERLIEVITIIQSQQP